jgi:hypothetical protein
MLYKDSCNRKSNQQNLGTIKCSNLCTEIIEYTSPEETAVCNLASIALPRYVREHDGAQSSGRPKLTGSLNAQNRQVLSQTPSGVPAIDCKEAYMVVGHFLSLGIKQHGMRRHAAATGTLISTNCGKSQAW